MGLYREQGVVLRTWKLGEADRILHVLTPGRGKVRGVAKGVRRTGSRLGGRLEPYSHVDLQLHEGRSLDVVTQAQLITSFAAVRADYDLSMAAAGVVEAADRIAQEDESSVATFLLVLDALRRLAAAPLEPSVVLDAYLLRLVGTAGFLAIVDACAACGRGYEPAGASGAPIAFSVDAGGLLCTRCRPPEAALVAPGAVAVLRGLAGDPDWGAALVVEAALRDRRVAVRLVRDFWTHHVGRPLRSWDLVA